jgi:hypothetical protein
MNGVIRGAYHFFRPASDPVAQADYFLSVMGPSLPGDLPPAIDLEVLDNLSAAEVTQAALQFLQYLQQKTGRVPIVYTSARVMSLLGNPQGFTSYSLWVANWTTMCPSMPPEWSNWTFWQYSNAGQVDGIMSSELDVDQFNGTLSDLVGYAGGSLGNGGGGDGGVGDGGDVQASDAGETGTADDGGSVGVDAVVDPDPGPGAAHGRGCTFLPGPAGDVDAPLAGLILLGAIALTRRRRRDGGGISPSCRLRPTARSS